jgi:hypothetical protein
MWICKIEKSGSVAQLVEHLPFKQEVVGSIPTGPTIFMLWSSGLDLEIVDEREKRRKI